MFTFAASVTHGVGVFESDTMVMLKEVAVKSAIQRQGWDYVKNEQKSDRDKAKAAKSRQRAIGRELRRIYDDVTKEPVPDEFLDLLRKIDGSGGKGGQSDS